MTWRLELRHYTGYSYAAPVIASYNEARMTPITDLHQTTISADLTITPPSTIQRYWDYWGTQVVAFDLHEPHEELAVTSTAVVETEPAEGPTVRAPWAELQAVPVQDAFAELLQYTGYVPADPELVERGWELTAGLDPVDAVLAVCNWVHGVLEYEPGVTGVHTSAPDAWRAGRGVCQDYAHLALVLIRGLGIPARYVSGYLHPVVEAELGVTVRGESHAWIEAFTGGWWGHDPTNDVAIGERHVTVARGRDYADVSPLRGIFSGGRSTALGVEVEVTRAR
jgi:transglutaminase-like putative cysteine protease